MCGQQHCFVYSIVRPESFRSKCKVQTYLNANIAHVANASAYLCLFNWVCVHLCVLVIAVVHLRKEACTQSHQHSSNFLYIGSQHASTDLGDQLRCVNSVHVFVVVFVLRMQMHFVQSHSTVLWTQTHFGNCTALNMFCILIKGV